MATQRDINDRLKLGQSFLGSPNANAIWGALYTDQYVNPDTSADASTPYGQQPQWGNPGGVRADYTHARATTVQDFLRQAFPNATQDQLNQAALQAYSVNDRWDNENTRPQDMIVQVAGKLGGLSPEAQAQLQSMTPQWEAEHDTMVQARQAQDSRRNSNDLKDFGIAAAIFGGPLLANSMGLFGAGGSADAGGLLATNSFDSGAMASAMGYSPTATAGGGLLAENAFDSGAMNSAMNGQGFTLDPTMLDATKLNVADYMPSQSVMDANIAGAMSPSTFAPGTLAGMENGGGLLDRVGNWAAQNPSTVAQLVGGLVGGATAGGAGGGGSQNAGPATQYPALPARFNYQKPTFEQYRGGLLYG